MEVRFVTRGDFRSTILAAFRYIFFRVYQEDPLEGQHYREAKIFFSIMTGFTTLALLGDPDQINYIIDAMAYSDWPRSEEANWAYEIPAEFHVTQRH